MFSFLVMFVFPFCFFFCSASASASAILHTSRLARATYMFVCFVWITICYDFDGFHAGNGCWVCILSCFDLWVRWWGEGGKGKGKRERYVDLGAGSLCIIPTNTSKYIIRSWFLFPVNKLFLSGDMVLDFIDFPIFSDCFGNEC